MATLSLDLVTPTRKIIEGGQVEFVNLPSVLGEIRVLPGHAPLLAEMQIGELYFDLQGKTRKFAVSYGFVEVMQDRVVVLAETCEEAHELDRQRATAAQKKAEEKLAGPLSTEDFRKYQFKLQRSLVRQKLSS